LGERVKNIRRPAKKLVLELLLKLDEKNEYSYMELMGYLIRNGVPVSAAEYYMRFLPLTSALERIDRGIYRVNKEQIKKMLEELNGGH